MAKVKEEKEQISNFERCWKILEYLKKNTDENHTVTQVAMRQSSEYMDAIMGRKETYNLAINSMARALNLEDGYPKRDEEQRIIFDKFKEKYCYDKFCEDESEEAGKDKKKKRENFEIRHLYYNPVFSYDELNYIEEAILFSKTIDMETTDKLIKKLEEELTSKYYRHGPRNICKVNEPDLMVETKLRENLSLIQRAIDNHVKISFQFNGYNERRKLQPVKRGIDVVSPYYIVANGGRYYLIACRDMENKKIKPNMSIWRIDLMTDVTIPGLDEVHGKYGIAALPKNRVENLPQEWSENFHLSHLNMSFDEPVWITLRVKGPEWRTEEDRKRFSPDYTFLYDWFGDTFRMTKKGIDGSLDDEVKVLCSPYGMANWAMQYSDRVEVLEPQNVRQMVIDKIKRQMEKYGL